MCPIINFPWKKNYSGYREWKKFLNVKYGLQTAHKLYFFILIYKEIHRWSFRQIVKVEVKFFLAHTICYITSFSQSCQSNTKLWNNVNTILMLNLLHVQRINLFKILFLVTLLWKFCLVLPAFNCVVTTIWTIDGSNCHILWYYQPLTQKRRLSFYSVAEFWWIN